MHIDAFDLADVMGWAHGRSGEIPESGSMRLRKRPEVSEVGAQRLGKWLFERWSQPALRPDIVIVERAQEIAATFQRNVRSEDGAPAFSGSADAVRSQILYHGALHAVAGLFDIEVYAPTAATVRKHLCGAASAAPPRKRGSPLRTSEEKRRDREATKRMVLDRLVMMRYLPRDCTDTDRADAVAVWAWGDGSVARTAPRELHLFAR